MCDINKGRQYRLYKGVCYIIKQHCFGTVFFFFNASLNHVTPRKPKCFFSIGFLLMVL